MKRKELERLEEEKQWKEEQERLAKEAAAREAERKQLEEVSDKSSLQVVESFNISDEYEFLATFSHSCTQCHC